MPRITLEERKEVASGIFQIKEKVYEMPEHIVYKGQYLTYDSHSGDYTHGASNISIAAVDYLSLKLKEAKHKKDKEQE